MKNILIVSYFFAPANMMGAVRGTKLAKYFSRLGYNVTVICSKDNKLLFMPIDVKEDVNLKKDIENIECIRIGHSYAYQKIAFILYKINKKIFPKGTIQDNNNDKKNNNKSNTLKKFLKNSIHLLTYLTTLGQDMDYKSQVLKSIKKEKINIHSYDVVISTYGPLGSHLVGEAIKKIVPDINWICDFRDPMVLNSEENIQNKISRYIQSKMCKKANYITAVSNGNLEMITEGKYKEKSFTITNGYDMEDIKLTKNNLELKKLSFVYTGTTYAGKRDLSPIFKSIRELINEKKIDKNNIMFNYAGTEIDYLKKQANAYNLTEIIRNYGYISRSESINLQSQADLLVVSTWNDNNHKGVLPGKFLEYMSYKKNIIGIINGNLESSEMTSIIREYNLGIAYEKVNDELDYENLKKYIYTKYLEWSKNGVCSYEADVKKVELHDYRSICNQFKELF
ncbi:hypothetical protein K1514_09180 [Paraclostridium bifermentans]|uniref:hypothetical protein n=1 Tax=Paraclostridium TaxID=1849822 RepID=UPI001CC3E7D7|nr:MULTISPECIES: hypothetical protein [Paraclostridium]MBZ6006060.1 hypothetical protein [Paraclostridium bifermentans]MDU0298452.1 hypothetical protein [Paraclostridium sp. MRS3W1]